MDDAEPYIINIECVLEFFEGELNSELQVILESVAAIEENAFSDYWSVDSIADTLKYDYNKLLIAKRSFGNVTEIVGYLLYNEIADETELLRIAVDKRCRGEHIGEKLLNTYMDTAKGKCEKGFLEVRASNEIARKLYEKNGYTLLDTRKDYYSNPNEDGMVYEIIL